MTLRATDSETKAFKVSVSTSASSSASKAAKKGKWAKYPKLFYYIRLSNCYETVKSWMHILPRKRNEYVKNEFCWNCIENECCWNYIENECCRNCVEHLFRIYWVLFLLILTVWNFVYSRFIIYINGFSRWLLCSNRYYRHWVQVFSLWKSES